MRAKSLKDDQPRVVFNSNKIRHDSVIGHEYSPNGKFCALTMSDKNQISIEVMIIDVETAETHGKCLQLFSFERIAWGANSDGFFIYVNICAECLYTNATDTVLCLLPLFGTHRRSVYLSNKAKLFANILSLFN